MTTSDPENTKIYAPTVEVRALLGVFALYWRMDEAFCRQEVMHGLGRMECYLMMQLDAPRRMGELARLMTLVPSAVTSAADRLERDGLAQRVRDTEDRRAFRLQLTPKGRDLRRELENKAGDAFREISGLSAADIQKFATLSGKIQNTILGPGNSRPDKEI